jgi:outer membrane receptor protein involved in Fe transport
MKYRSHRWTPLLAFGFMASPVFAQTTVAPDNSANEMETVVVTANRLNNLRNGILTETGSSIYRISQKDIQSLPQSGNTPFNQVLLQAPGVAQDSYGQLHVRGDHGDLQYRLNGILLPESISGFGQTLDTQFIDTVSLLTGALPAEYGYRTAGVVNVQTKSGDSKPGGDVGIEFGSHDTRTVNANVHGSSNDFTYFINGSYNQSNLGIENPTADRNAIHDRALQNKEFGYFSYRLNQDMRVSLILGNSDSRFQIPNTAGLTPDFTLTGAPDYASSNLDERQRERTRYGILALQGAVGSRFNYQLALFSRYSDVNFQPDNQGDLVYNGVASSVFRRAAATGLQADAALDLTPAHTLRMGVDYTHERLTNNSNSLVFPVDGDGNQSSSDPFAITDNSTKSTNQFGLYLQDEWKLSDRLTLNYGARADWIDAYIKASQLSPRVGLVFQLNPKTTLHAGYSRYFTPPTNELIGSSTVAKFAGTSNQAANDLNSPVQAERSHYFDAGISHRLTPSLTLGADAYYKKVKSLLDEGQFGAALLYTPFNYADGAIWGVELSATYHQDNLSAYVNLSRSTASGTSISSGQYNFGADELTYIANNTVHLDHDQRLTGSAGMAYTWGDTTFSGNALFGSGLRAGFANTDHLPAYFTVNLGVSKKLHLIQAGTTTVRLSLVNAFDRVYELRDGSGIGVGAPQYGARRGLFLGLNQSF